MTIDQLVAAPVLTPFVAISENSCRSCGGNFSWWDRFWGGLRCRTISVVTHRYCPGGKVPTEIRAGMTALMLGETEVFNPCAGINEPHIHVQCRGCGYSWLMRVKEGKL